MWQVRLADREDRGKQQLLSSLRMKEKPESLGKPPFLPARVVCLRPQLPQCQLNLEAACSGDTHSSSLEANALHIFHRYFRSVLPSTFSCPPRPCRAVIPAIRIVSRLKLPF